MDPQFQQNMDGNMYRERDRDGSGDKERRRSRSRDRERDRDRDRRDRDRDRGDRGDRDRDHKEKDKKSKKSSRDDRDKKDKRRSRSPKKSSRGKSRSPSPELKKKKSGNWDVAPPGFEGMNVAQVARINPSVLVPLLNTQNTQQSRQARRLYIGNILAGVTEQQLAAFFNEAMQNASVNKGPPPPLAQSPVLAVQMNFEKNFAFIEFRSAVDATAGMLLDGITLQGQSLKIRRPKDYQPPPGEAAFKPDESVPDDNSTNPTVHIATGLHLPGIVSTNVPDSPNKIFIGGLPAYLKEEDVKELVSSYGQLKSFNLVKDSATGNSKGYAFFEYLDESITDRACQGLNGMKLGDKTLIVQRATIGARQSIAYSQQMGQPVNSPAANFLNLSVPVGTLLASLPMTAGAIQPTNVLMLLNMVSGEDLYSDEDYQEIFEDIKSECERFGHVLSMKIPRPLTREEEDKTPGVGKIFVEFDSSNDAQKAQQALGGRKYQGRTVITSYFEPDYYHQDQFD